MTDKPKTLKQMKQEASLFRVRDRYLRHDTDGGGWRDWSEYSYYMRESSMRSPQTGLVYKATSPFWEGKYEVQVERRDDAGEWEEIPDYDWN